MYFKIPLNSLNTFACAARYESFQQAATELHISPSAVSHQIRNLEQQLGYKLFQRLDKRVALTEPGLTLFQSLNQPFHQLHQATEQALKPPSPVVRISCAPLLATRWLMPRLQDFQRQHPTIEIALEATSERIDLDTAALDGVIRHGARHWPQMHELRSIEERAVIACRPGLLKRQGGSVTPEQLAQLPLLDIAAHPDRWQEWFSRFGLKTDRRACSMVVQNGAQAIEACLMSDHFMLLDSNMITSELQNGSLVIAADVECDQHYAFSLLWPRQRVPKPAFIAFRDWLATQLESA